MGEGGETFKGRRAFEGGGEGFAEDNVVWCVEGNMGDVHLEMLVGVSFSCVAVQCEGFLLARETCGCDGVNERVTTLGWVWW